MTLGGLALAVGILVDESTVEIENLHTRLSSGIPRARAVVQATRLTVLPRFLSMICILAVFLPSFFLTGVGQQLFVPLSLAVAFAMIASFLLSSSLVPVLSTWLMKEQPRDENRTGLFKKLHNAYAKYLRGTLRYRWPLTAGYLGLSLLCISLLLPSLGSEIFPSVDAPLLQLRLRAPTGTRIEETEPLVLQAIDVIKQTVGAENVAITSDYVGTQPASYPVNLIYLFTAGPQEVVVRIGLNRGMRGDEALRERIRLALRRSAPQLQVSFEAADIISQVMNFGSPTPVDVTVQGPALEDDYAFARKIHAQMKNLPFLRDLQFAQQLNYPTVHATVDRERAGQFGLTMSNIAQSYVAATASSRFTTPNYWRDPKSGNAFQIQVQYSQHRMQSVADIESIPVMQSGESQPYLGEVAKITTPTMAGEIDRYNGQRVITLTANLHNVSLGKAIAPIKQSLGKAGIPPRGISIHMRGEAPALQQTLRGYRPGFCWPSRPSSCCFIGAIMAVGIAVANSILLLSFAERHRLEEKRSSFESAQAGATSRLRAILMTASAMIFGVLPMAWGAGEGGAQTAPLGRAVIGGLLFATFATLTFLPAIYSILQKNASVYSLSLNPYDPSSRHYERP